MPSAYDKKAVKILFDRFWSAKGWKKEAERITSAEDFEYAVARGVMFQYRVCFRWDGSNAHDVEITDYH